MTPIKLLQKFLLACTVALLTSSAFADPSVTILTGAPITVCVNQSTTVTFEANVSGVPTATSECTVSDLIWSWSGGGPGSISSSTSTASVPVSFSQVGDYTVSATAKVSYSTSCGGPYSASASGSVTVHVVNAQWVPDGGQVEPQVQWVCSGLDAVPSVVAGYYKLKLRCPCDGAPTLGTKTCNLSLVDQGAVELYVGTPDDQWVERFKETDDCHGSEDGQIYDLTPDKCCDSSGF